MSSEYNDTTVVRSLFFFLGSFDVFADFVFGFLEAFNLQQGFMPLFNTADEKEAESEVNSVEANNTCEVDGRV